MPCWRSEHRCGHWLAHNTNSWPGGHPFSSDNTQTEGHEFSHDAGGILSIECASPRMLITGCAEYLNKDLPKKTAMCWINEQLSLHRMNYPWSKLSKRKWTWWVCLTAGFGVAGFDLVLLSLTLLPTVLGWRAGAGAGPYRASSTTALITAGPGTPARPASIHYSINTQTWKQAHTFNTTQCFCKSDNKYIKYIYIFKYIYIYKSFILVVITVYLIWWILCDCRLGQKNSDFETVNLGYFLMSY